MTHSKKAYHLKDEEYFSLYEASIRHPETFWDQIAKQELDWFAPWKEVRHQVNTTHWQWFTKAKLNITYNCLDRHVLAGRGEKVAFITLDENNQTTTITYQELLEQVNACANALQTLGVNKGDRVVIYMPLIIEQVVTMLACARLGAIHSVVFAGFSAPALQLRLQDTEATTLVTGTWTQRRGKKIDLLSVARKARHDSPTVKNTLIIQRPGDTISLHSDEYDYAKLISQSSTEFEPVQMDSEDPLFILYTSGTTGQPKGIVHTSGGYNLYTHLTTKYTFDLHEDDVYWCTADPGWITGHSYMVYGPLSVGVTSVIAEGAPDYPDAERWWKIVDMHQVNVLYTAPTAIRLLMKYGEELPQKYSLNSLRILGSVGEPINPSAWHWFHKYVGKKQTTVVDTWWQTETGGHMLVTLPALPQKPGWAGRPFLGIEPDVVDDNGHSCKPNHKGFLVIKQPWPSAFRTCWKNDKRYQQYWTHFPPYYFTGDFAIQDDEGYIQVLGRSDDVLNVAGHRLGTAEVESALVAHPAVVESAVIALPDELKGEKLIAFITLQNHEDSENLANELREHVKSQIGRFAHIERFNFTTKLPKTRSGKIMRRLLRAQELGETLGDTSTLED